MVIPKYRIGRDTWVGIKCLFYSSLPAKIKIGSFCDIAPNTVFITGSHLIGDEIRRAGKAVSYDISIGKGTWIGASSTILGGALCRRILEDYDEYSSLVICLYSETEIGKALALGEKIHFTQHEINEAWLIFYSYHPVEGDYFDDKPGKYLDL